MPFEDDEVDLASIVKNKYQIRKTNEGSVVNKPSMQPKKQEALEKEANEFAELKASFKEDVFILNRKFASIVNDKTLPRNKSSKDIDQERELLSQLASLSVEMDNAEVEGKTAGAVGLASAALGYVLLQRNKINELNYKVESLNAALNALLEAFEDIKNDRKK